MHLYFKSTSLNVNIPQTVSSISKKLQQSIPDPPMMEGIRDVIMSIKFHYGNLFTIQNKKIIYSKYRGRFLAVDRLHVLLSGSETYRVISPDHAHRLHTVSPTYAVAPNGLSYPIKPYLLKQVINETTSTSTPLPLPQIFQTNYSPENISIDENLNFITNENDYFTSHSTTFTIHAGDVLYVPTGWVFEMIPLNTTATQCCHVALDIDWKPPQWNHAFQFEVTAIKELLKALRQEQEQNINIGIETTEVEHDEL